MKQWKLEEKNKKIILAVVAAIMVIIAMILAVGSLKKKSGYADGLEKVRAGNTNISKDEERKQRLVVAADSIDGILNPLTVTASGDLAACELVFEPLAKQQADGGYENVLAERVSWDQESLTLTVQIKDGIKFSDGTLLTADDVCASIGAHCLTSYNLDTDSPYFNIKGAWEMNEQDAQTIEGIRKLDDKTVAVSFFKEDAANWTILETLIQKNDFALIGEQFSGFSELDNLMGQAIGTGAYALEHMSYGLSVVLQANSYYREPIADIKEVEIVKINFYDMQKNLDAHKVDVISYSANSEQFQMIYDAAQYDVYTKPEDKIYALGFNMDNIYLKEKKVRQAIAYAIDRSKMIGKDWKKQFEETNQIGCGTEKEKSFTTGAIAYNKKQANSLMEEMKMKDRMTLRLPVQSENEFQKQVALEVKRCLEEIGIAVMINEYTNEEYVRALYVEDNFDLYLFTATMGYEWEDLYAFTTPRNGLPVACEDESLKTALEHLDQAGDMTTYQTALKETAASFYEAVPAIPLARTKSYVSVSADLSGFSAEAGAQMLKGVHKIVSSVKNK